MKHNEELEYRGWKIVCKISGVTKRTRYFMWSPNRVNMGGKDHLESAKQYIDGFEDRKPR